MKNATSSAHELEHPRAAFKFFCLHVQACLICDLHKDMFCPIGARAYHRYNQLWIDWQAKHET